MDISKVKIFLGDDWKAFESLIAEVLHSSTDLLNMINGRVLSCSGKQLRPMLALLSARACGEANEISIRCATASELIHTATLLHDDVADNSPVRRGQPTIMSLFGPSVSVLVGDYWLSKAMALLVGCAGDNIILAFSKALEELAEGELLQLQKASTADTVMDDYLKIISCKTASLFKAAVLGGAYSVQASDECLGAMKAYAGDLGLAFQMRDDIFDYMPQMSVGKNLGVDILEQKITLPLLEALKNAGAAKAEEIRDKVRNISEHNEYRKEIMDFVNEYDGIGCAEKVLENYSRRAVSHLSVLPDSEERELLEQLALYVGVRNS